jgi:predicted metal-dependent enzyme (double-stranded beta helix superfamily)
MKRLRDFVVAATRAMGPDGLDETNAHAKLGPLLRTLVATDDWLPQAFAEPDPVHYRQYLLHCDPLERFCVASFVWGPGQKTPIHDHTVWGLVGILRGAEQCRFFARKTDGTLEPAGEERLEQGQLSTLGPQSGDIHEVANACSDRVSVAIHVYGANIGAVARRTFDPATGALKNFVSGYAAATLPNLWDRSAEIRASLP